MSNTIVVENSYCTLRNCSEECMAIVKEALTYDNEEAVMEMAQAKKLYGIAIHKNDYFQANKQKMRIQYLSHQLKICWLRDNSFPTGHLMIVAEALINLNMAFEIDDKRQKPKPTVEFNWYTSPHSDRYYQAEMLDIAPKECRGVYEAAVGSGKTHIMLKLVKMFAVRTLIIAPSKDLAIQISNVFTEHFGEDAAALLTPTKAIKNDLPPIRIMTGASLASMMKKDQLEDFLDDVDMLCIDEVHHAGSKTYTDLLPYFNHIYYRFGFSGTFLRNDSKTLDMYGFLSNVLYRYPAWKATEEGFLTPLEVEVHEMEGKNIGRRKMSPQKAYQTEYNLNYCGEDLLFEIKNIIMEVGPTEQILILVGRKDAAGKILHEYLDTIGISNRYISGDDKKAYVKETLESFNKKETRILIGSTIIGEGIDIRSTDHLIMAQGGKSEIATTQALGRGARLFPGKTKAVIHDFHFKNTKYLSKHLKKRLQIYEKNFAAKIL